MLHAKTAVIDGVFSTVGSSNLDWRSFTANNEINAVILGDDFGREDGSDVPARPAGLAAHHPWPNGDAARSTNA